MRSVDILFVLLLLLGICHADAANDVGDLFASGDTEAARQALSDVTIDPEDSRARYLAGRLARLDGDAKRHFRAVLRHPDSAYADDAQFELAESVYADPQGLYVTARKLFRTFVESYPESTYRPLALYRIGRTLLITAVAGPGQSQVDSARVLFREVISRYPDTPVARYAAVALVEADLRMGDAEAMAQDRLSLPQKPVWAGEAALYKKLAVGPNIQD